uniref:SprT-like domain-containing protein n=1 Tax=viral metagenome TaxID=1070528 RepID=A0A6M3J086_9ZZZZ
MSKPYTKKDLELFEKLGREWEAILGLQDWDIGYRFPVKDDGKDFGEGRCAITLPNTEAMNAAIVVSERDTNYDIPVAVEANETVLHELLHLFLRPLTRLGEARFGVTQERMDYEEHRIIQRLVKLLMGARCEN